MDKFHDSPVARNIVTLNPCFQCAIIISYYYILLCVLIKIHPQWRDSTQLVRPLPEPNMAMTSGTQWMERPSIHLCNSTAFAYFDSSTARTLWGAWCRNWQNDVLPFPFLYWVATSSLQIVLYVIACHHRSAWGPGVS